MHAWDRLFVSSLISAALLVTYATAIYSILEQSAGPVAGNGMPCILASDVGGQRPTLVAARGLAFPSTLGSCNEIVLDVPLGRRWPTSMTRPLDPIRVHFYLWRVPQPWHENWAFHMHPARLNASWSPSVPSEPSTWDPCAHCLYRFRLNMTSHPIRGGENVTIGFVIEQPGTRSLNQSIYWLGTPGNAPTPGSLNRAFYIIDVYGNAHHNLSLAAEVRRFSSLPYHLSAYAINDGQYPIGFLALNAFANCSGTDTRYGPTFAQLPPPTWHYTATDTSVQPPTPSSSPVTPPPPPTPIAVPSIPATDTSVQPPTPSSSPVTPPPPPTPIAVPSIPQATTKPTVASAQQTPTPTLTPPHSESPSPSSSSSSPSPSLITSSSSPSQHQQPPEESQQTPSPLPAIDSQVTPWLIFIAVLLCCLFIGCVLFGILVFRRRWVRNAAERLKKLQKRFKKRNDNYESLSEDEAEMESYETEDVKRVSVSVLMSADRVPPITTSDMMNKQPAAGARAVSDDDDRRIEVMDEPPYVDVPLETKTPDEVERERLDDLADDKKSMKISSFMSLARDAKDI